MTLLPDQILVIHGGMTLVLFGGLLAIAVIDQRQLRIPDVLSLPLIGIGLSYAVLLLPSALMDHLIGAAVGFALLAGIGEFYFRRHGVEGLGLGDAKLFSAAGAWLGWQALPMVLLISALGGLVFAVVARKTRGSGLAFGPWLALGFFATWVWQTHFGGHLPLQSAVG